MQAVLDDLALGDALEVEARAHAFGVLCDESGALALGRQAAVVVRPGGEALRRRRNHIAQHLAPEPRDPLGFRAVEGDLDLLDRCHPSSVAHNAAVRRGVPPVIVHGG